MMYKTDVIHKEHKIDICKGYLLKLFAESNIFKCFKPQMKIQLS